ncbi:MAG TPA: hypothetical protein VFK41_04125 [Nocardioidaceae bacterium]|nr:hypothetical protein [Nocardioidaceae bacterium]
MSTDESLGRLRRWELSGGAWRVLSRSDDGIVVALLTCDAGEEMDRIVTTAPEVLEYVGHRSESGS